MGRAFFAPMRSCTNAPIKKVNLNRALEPVQILCFVEHIACLILKGVAGYVKRIRLLDAGKHTKDEQEA